MEQPEKLYEEFSPGRLTAAGFTLKRGHDSSRRDLGFTDLQYDDYRLNPNSEAVIIVSHSFERDAPGAEYKHTGTTIELEVGCGSASLAYDKFERLEALIMALKP